MYHALISDAQRECLPSTQANNHNYYGTVVSGSSSKGYNVRFDALPHEENIVESFSRQKLTVVLAGEEEKDYDRPPQFDSETTATTSNKTLFTKSADDFCSMSEKDIAVAKSFEMRYGNNDGDRINWEILADNIHIQEDDDDCMNIPNQAELIPEIDLETPQLSSTFFKHFFPDTTGHAKIMDDYLSDSQANFHETYVNDKIQFHDPDDPDPDWKVNQGYTLIIAAATEIENGIDNLWKHGPSGGHHDYPDFGRYMPKNEFKCFTAAAPYCTILRYRQTRPALGIISSMSHKLQ